MSSFVFIVIGVALVYLGMTQKYVDFIYEVSGMAKPSKVNLGNFFLASVIISIPSIALESTGHKEEAWYYTFLIMLSMMVFYRDEISQLSGSIEKEYRNG